MDANFETVFARYTQRIADEEAVWQTADPRSLFARRDEFLLSVGEEVARFLHALAVARKARTILELGTSYGYSTLFLAAAAKQTGGRLLTLEIDGRKQEFARQQISDAGLGEYVEWHLGDATRVLADLDGPFDLVLIDLWKDLYIPCLDLVYPKLADNAIIAADNMIEPAMARADANAYRAAVRAIPELHSVLLPIGSGIELSCVWRQEPR